MSTATYPYSLWNSSAFYPAETLLRAFELGNGMDDEPDEPGIFESWLILRCQDWLQTNLPLRQLEPLVTDLIIQLSEEACPARTVDYLKISHGRAYDSKSFLDLMTRRTISGLKTLIPTLVNHDLAEVIRDQFEAVRLGWTVYVNELLEGREPNWLTGFPYLDAYAAHVRELMSFHD